MAVSANARPKTTMPPNHAPIRSALALFDDDRVADMAPFRQNVSLKRPPANPGAALALPSRVTRACDRRRVAFARSSCRRDSLILKSTTLVVTAAAPAARKA